MTFMIKNWKLSYIIYIIGVGCYFEESENRDGESSVWRKKEREEKHELRGDF